METGAASPTHAERRQWRHERHEMREKLRQLADMVQREAARREGDVEALEVRLAAATAEIAALKRDLERSRSTEVGAVRSAENAQTAKQESMRAVFEEAEREFNERWVEEAEARQEAEARADLALRRQLQLDQLLADQAEEAALMLAELQSYREQAEAERRLREAQDAKHARELTELAARWERRLVIERGALERERMRITAEKHRISTEQQVQVGEQARLRDDVARERLDSAVTTGKAYAESILRRVERQVDERHAAERAAAASPPLVAEDRRR
jgi:hypothetical protein